MPRRGTIRRGAAGAVSQAMKYIAKGTYQRGTISVASFTPVVGTEYEVTDVATNLAATSADKLFPWIRGLVYLGSTTTNWTYFEWALVKQESTASIPNLDDADAIEKLKKDGQLFGRGIISQPGLSYSGGRPIKFEFRNVSLRAGQELILFFRARVAVAIVGEGLLEWTEVVA